MEINEFIKNCDNDFSGFKCWAKKIIGTSDIGCSKKCLPLVMDGIFNLIDHKLPICKNNQENYCMTNNSLEQIMALASTCQKPCKNMQYSYVEDVQNYIPTNPIAKHQLEFILIFNNVQLYKKEYYILDFLGYVGSLGGLMGLFFGFSFFGVIASIIDNAISKEILFCRSSIKL